MTLQRIANRLMKIERERDRQLDKLGREIRRKLVVPACRKYALTFVSGMGTYYFHGNYDDEDDVTRLNATIDERLAAWLGWKDVVRAYNALNAAVDERGQLGCWVADVTEKDLAKKGRKKS